MSLATNLPLVKTRCVSLFAASYSKSLSCLILLLAARACAGLAMLHSLIQRLAVLCCFAMLLLVGTVHATTPNTYTIAAVEYPGFAEPKAAVGHLGLAVELARAAFDAVDISVVFEPMPMARLMLETIAGKHVMMMGSVWYYPDETRENLHLIPMFPVTNVAFFNKSHFTPQTDDVFEIFRRQTIVSSFVPKSAIAKGMKHRVVRDPASVLNLVMSGREKLGILPWLALADLSRRNFPNRADEIQILNTAIIRAPAGLAFALNHPESEVASAAFSKGLSIIESNGVADEIRSRYYPSLKELEEVLSLEAVYEY